MKKLIKIITLCVIMTMFCEVSYATTEFIDGTPPEHETQSSKEAKIRANDYYFVFDIKNEDALGANAYIPFTELFIYDKDMNLLHKEDFGGGVCVRDAGYCNGVFYCTYSEKIVEVHDENGTHYQRSYGEIINRNNPYEKIVRTTVKSTDMINWEECDDKVPVCNSRVGVSGGSVSLFNSPLTEVLYENGNDYMAHFTMDFSRLYPKMRDWFVSYKLSKEGFIEDIYISNDFVYFIPIALSDDTRNEMRKAPFSYAYNVFEHNDNIIFANYYNKNYYLKTDADEVHKRLEAIKDAPYVKLQNKILGFEQPPVIENGRTLVPMRFIFERMGAEVQWNGETRSVTATKDGVTVTLAIDDTNATVNGKTTTLDVPARLINDKTMIPLRFLSENLGYTVDWDADSRTAVID